MHPVKLIMVERAEGLTEECVPREFTTWAEAEAYVRAAALTAPRGGGYAKTDCKVLWDSGQVFAFRLDLTYDHAFLPTPIANEAKSEIATWAGRRCPPDFTAGDYLAFRARFAAYAKEPLDVRDARYVALLDECAFSDAPAPVITCDGSAFTYADHQQLARLIWRRWGCDTAAAAVAWRRLLQNNCSDTDFAALLTEEKHHG